MKDEILGIPLSRAQKEKLRSDGLLQGRSMAGHARFILSKFLRGELVEAGSGAVVGTVPVVAVGAKAGEGTLL